MSSSLWPSASGEMAELFRRHDWHATPLGAAETWSERLRALVDLLLCLPQPACLGWGPTGLSLYNDSYARLLGERHPAALGRSLREVWPEICPHPTILEAVMAGTAHTSDRPVRLAHGADRTGTWYTFSWTPVPCGTGGVEGFLSIAQETSEAALRDIETRFRLIVESARDYAIFTTDAEGTITSWPPGAAAVFGWSEAEIVGQPMDITFVPEDREAGVPASERETAARDGVAADRREHLRKDGSRVFIDGWTRPLVDDDLRGFIKIGQDVTDRRRAEERIRRNEERLEVLNAELQHRTRNLLTVVRSIADRTLERSRSLPEFRASFRERLEALARVNALLSRLGEHDRITFGELIRTELAAHGVLGNDGNHGSQVDLEGPEGVRLRSSHVQTLALGLHELTTNAIKYGALSRPEGRLRIRWSIDRAQKDKPRLRVEWVETGLHLDFGPDGEPPRRGYGRELIERALVYQLDAQTSYEITPEGVRCVISLPVYGADRG